jgi:hypothetical protein
VCTSQEQPTKTKFMKDKFNIKPSLFGAAIGSVILVLTSTTGCTTSRPAAIAEKTHAQVLTVTPEIKKAFHSGDGIKIRSVTGTAPKFHTGGNYRVVGTCRQQNLKNATLYLGNTAETGSDAIAASAGSSLYKPLPNGNTEFDITFTLLRPGLLHLTIYDLDNHDKNDNAYAGIYLGDVVFRR